MKPHNEIKPQITQKNAAVIGKVIVIGSGPAGLTAAYELNKRGVEVEVFEASAQVGGMAASFTLWNQRVDHGPHRFFSSDPRVNRLWLEAVQGQYEMVSRLTRIFYKKRFFYYPLRAFNALVNLGPVEAVRCVVSYLLERLGVFGKRDQSVFDGWVISRFGRRLYGIFFKTYSEKLWGIPCSMLDADFAAQRIKNFSLGVAILSLIFPSRSKKHKTLVDEFAYPRAGSGFVYENMAAQIRKNGGAIHFNRAIKRVIIENSKVIGVECCDGEIISADYVVSSMPLTDLVKGLDSVSEAVLTACQQLKYRNTILVYLKLDGSDLFPDNWLYVHDSTLRTGRITNFRNWLPSLYGNERATIVTMEYWCYDCDPIWRDEDSKLIDLAKRELGLTGLARNIAVLDGCVRRLPRCYPVYNVGYKEALKPIQSFVSGITGLSVIGRYGAFKYNNQDHSILMGLLAAENIHSGTKHDLWMINTDYEYQEATVITKTGLQKTSG